jgi:hypothetical protein
MIQAVVGRDEVGETTIDMIEIDDTKWKGIGMGVGIIGIEIGTRGTAITGIVILGIEITGIVTTAIIGIGIIVMGIETIVIVMGIAGEVDGMNIEMGMMMGIGGEDLGGMVMILITVIKSGVWFFSAFAMLFLILL